MKTEKYQIFDSTEELNHAGTKATMDITQICEQMHFKKLPVRKISNKYSLYDKIKRQAYYAIDWEKCYNTIEKNSIVLLQHPFHYKQLLREKILLKLKNQKKVKFISLVHDVEELRKSRYDSYYEEEFNFMLRIADVLIVHNVQMKQFFLSKGVQEEKIVVLEIFDYLQCDEKIKKPKFDRSISIAGNLDVEKCQYLGELGKLNRVTINLYGPNFSESLKTNKNIIYHGSFPANEISAQLCQGFGLVWDGKSIDTCNGDYGEYLKYNNPHKLSLYLSSGIPVIIWAKAAEAPFVKQNNLGICVDSLQQLEKVLCDLSEDRYLEFSKSVFQIRSRLIKGVYTKKAISTALDIINY